ncbi:MAG: DUF4330 family protein [Clostridia bacterium]|nr:DUF4330 family protein [Clostridia bacterium]MBQ8418874.1 DUF4330 family protein [Clostridia bacterium]
MPISEKKRSGAHFNLFDVILILVIIACITGIALHAYFTKDLTETYSETANISFVVSGVSEKTADAFCVVGASLYAQDSDRIIGTLLESSYAPLFLDLENAEGLLVKAKHPDKKEITANASFTGTWTDDGFLIGGTTLAIVGKEMKIYTENAVCTIVFTSVSK